LLNTGVVTEMALSSSPITNVWNNVGGFTWSGKDPELASDFSVTNVTHDLEISRLANIMGRDFSTSFKIRSAAIIINETAAKIFGVEKSSRVNL